MPNDKKKKKFARNPADVAAGIDASKIGMSSEAQRTASTKEVEQFKKTGFSPANERALRATGEGRGEFIGPLQDPESRLPQDQGEQALPETLGAIGEKISETGLNLPSPIGLNLLPALPTLQGVLSGTITGLSVATGVGLLAKGTGSVIAKSAAGQKLTSSIIKETIKLGKGRIQINTYTAAKTTSWLSKLAKTARNPTFVASALLSTIGSYPFAGFIKEEALQTLSFAVRTAVNNEDVAGAEAAIQQTAEILEPSMWSQILASVPYANILVQLQNFYEAATTKLANDAKNVELLKTKQVETEQANIEKLQQQQKEGFTIAEEDKPKLKK